RRHTRFSRDWSSDVCSSDLVDEGRAVKDFEGGSKQVMLVSDGTGRLASEKREQGAQTFSSGLQDASNGRTQFGEERIHFGVELRSEERRVGQEGGPGGWP